ncbi:MAG: rhomboid family intramembrane serine protease [Rhodothermales bacterium]|nr:rhomboid family intramembrane serine protease [Rhodothermales bacterium]
MSDYYRPQTAFTFFPPVIKNLLILNGILFLAQNVVQMTQAIGLATVLNAMALYPIGAGPEGYSIFGTAITVPGFQIWQVVTYGFLHGGIGHLFFNMFALWMFGVQIEQDWGSRRFAIFYFVCVIGAAAAQLAVTYGAPISVPTIGASGGVFGILLAFGMMYPDRPIYFILIPIPIKAKYFVTFYGLVELYSGVARTGTGVAHFAHLGGMLFGFLLILYWRGKLPIKPKVYFRW